MPFFQFFAILFLLFGNVAESWVTMCQSKISVPTEYLRLASGEKIAFCACPGRYPGVIFCTGFRSSMTGQKAVALEGFCRKSGRSFVRFDYRGHGLSDGNFTDFALSDWIEDSLSVLDCIVQSGQHIVVGSSMGAWIAVHLALARPDRVAAILGIAAAPDFTEDIWNAFSPQDQDKLKRDGIVYRPSEYDEEPYPITHKLIEDGNSLKILHNLRTQSIACPVRLLHGLNDTDIPWQKSVDFAHSLKSGDAVVTLIKGGDHRLSTPNDLSRLLSLLDELLLTCSQRTPPS